MNLTMKNTFLLLALFVGAVRGDNHFVAEVQGVKLDEVYCTPTEYNDLYEECIVAVAKAHGVEFDRRRLELRGSRGLQSCSICPPNPPRGHWCYVKCGGYDGYRRLQADEENADTTTQTEIQEEAAGCYAEKAAMPAYSCLGAAEDLEITISLEE
jgi:hypothetical protein